MKIHYADGSCGKSCNTSQVTWDIQNITCMFCLNKLGIRQITYKEHHVSEKAKEVHHNIVLKNKKLEELKKIKKNLRAINGL